MKQLSISRFSDICLTAVLSGAEPQQLIDDVFEYVGTPILCFDVTFRTIGYRFPEGFTTESWLEIARYGYAPEESILKGGYLESQDIISGETEPVFFDESKPEVGFPQYCSSIYCGGKLFAYVGIGLGDAIPVQIRDCCRILARSLGLLLSKKKSPLLDAQQAEQMFISFLDGAFDSSDIAQFQSEHKAPYYLMAMTSDSAGAGTMEYTVSNLKSYFPGCLFCIRQSRIFGLACGAENVNPSDLSQEEKDYLEKYQLTLGVSDRFTLLTDIPLRQIQAQLAISYAKKKGIRNSSFSHDYLHILSGSTLKYYGRDASLSRYFQQILDLDLPWAVETIKAYYTAMGRASKAAELLDIHKNTFSNRISKLEDVTGCSLDDPKTAETLILDLYIYENVAEKGDETK